MSFLLGHPVYKIAELKKSRLLHGRIKQSFKSVPPTSDPNAKQKVLIIDLTMFSIASNTLVIVLFQPFGFQVTCI